MSAPIITSLTGVNTVNIICPRYVLRVVDALLIFAIFIVLALVALIIGVLRREFSRGNQTFKSMVWNGKMSSTGCYYNPEDGELELAQEFGGATLKMIELTAKEAISRKNGGVYLVFISEGQKQRPRKAMISKTPITMESARAIIGTRRGKGSKGSLNLYTYKEENAMALARGGLDIRPVLHRGGIMHSFSHYHRYFKDGEDGDEKSPRAFFGEPPESVAETVQKI